MKKFKLLVLLIFALSLLHLCSSAQNSISRSCKNSNERAKLEITEEGDIELHPCPGREIINKSALSNENINSSSLFEGQADELQAALNALGTTKKKVFNVNSEINVRGTKVIPENITIRVADGGRFNKEPGASLIIKGAFEAPQTQVFFNFEPGEIKLRGAFESFSPILFGLKSNDATNAQRVINNKALSTAFEVFSENVSGKSLVGGTIGVPCGEYFFSEPIVPTRIVRIKGCGTGSVQFATVFSFPAGKTGVRFWNDASGNNNPRESSISHIYLRAEGKKGSTADCLHHNVKITVDDVVCENFTREGFYADTWSGTAATGADRGNISPNANQSIYRDVLSFNNGSSGNLTASMRAGSNEITCAACEFSTSYSFGTLVRIAGARRLNITDVSNTTPVVVTVGNSYHDWGNDNSVTIGGVSARINRTWQITRIADNKFALNDSTASGSFSAGTATGDLIGQLAGIGRDGKTATLHLQEWVADALNADVTVRDAPLTVMGSGIKLKGNNSQLIRVEQFDSKANTGSGVYSETTYGVYLQGHTSGNFYNPEKIFTRSQKPSEAGSQAQGNCQCYSEGQLYPSDFRGVDLHIEGAEHGAGFTDRTRAGVSNDQKLAYNNTIGGQVITVNIPQNAEYYDPKTNPEGFTGYFNVSGGTMLQDYIDIRRGGGFASAPEVGLAPRGVGRFYYNPSTNQVQLSKNGSAFANLLTNADPFQINNVGIKPACNAANRFMFWTTPGNPGVKDKVEICAKGADEIFAWRTLF